ncbi:MAG: glycosyltransferase family 39 protein [Anaerolineae bacterium]|nr:glycosyltransferase family 39 protein [Anaerolineae bacterium]
MQAVNHEQPVSTMSPSVSLHISAEFIAYTVLIIFALLVRVADLDIVPMNETEATQALAAYQTVYTETPVQAQSAQSPIVFWLQSATFSLLGGDEFSARLPGVIGGMLLIFMPLLFRDRIGRERAFWLSVLLAVSPIAFAAARFATPTVWTMVFAFGLLWAIWRYWENGNQADIALGAIFFAALAFLSESGGLIFTLILALSGFVTVWWTVFIAPQVYDVSGDEIWKTAREFIDTIPFQRVLLIVAATVGLGSTLFFIYPVGLNIVAEVVRRVLVGFFQPYQAGTHPIMPILTLFVYNIWLVVLAVISAVILINNGQASFADRFAIVVTIVSFFVLLVYRGGQPAHALFMTVPMMWLVARLIHELTVNYAPTVFSYDSFQLVEDEDSYWWIKWVLAVIVLSLLMMLAVHWLEIGRGFMQLPSENIFAALAEARFAAFKSSLIWFVISLLFAAVGYFLAASLWGHTNALQGFGLGLVLFMLGSGVGTGWNTTVVNATNPLELWQNSATTNDAYLLRETLLEVADRDTMGFPSINLTILRDDSIGITDNGLIAWLVRDFRNAVFVDTLEEAQRDEIILMPVLEEDPDLDGSYVGQSFVIRQDWSLSSLCACEWISWLGQRRVRSDILAYDGTILWLRIDVYDDIPASERVGR